MAKLNTTTSIVDYLKSQGKDASFSSRKTLFKQSGLEDRLGSFVGSSTQNTALLKHLQQGASPTATVVKEPTGGGAQATVFHPDTGERKVVTVGDPQAFAGGFVLETPTQKYTPKLAGGGRKATVFHPETGERKVVNVGDPNAFTGGFVLETATDTFEKRREADKPAVIEEKEEAPEIIDEGGDVTEPDFNADDVMKFLDIPDINEADIINSVLESQDFKFLQEQFNLNNLSLESQAEVTQQYLDMQFEKDKKQLEDQFASRGLFMSGMRATQVATLASDLAASKLNVDRELATKLLQSNLNFKQDIFDLITDTVEQAKEGREEAIKQLNLAGFAVVGDQLVPTLAARKEAATQRREERRDELAQARLELSLAQFEFNQAKTNVQLAQAQARIEIAEANLMLAQTREARLAGGGGGPGFGSPNSSVNFTRSQYNSALGNFIASTGKTEADFKALDPGMQAAWLQGGPDEGIVTFQSALEDTADYLSQLRDAGKLSDLNYDQAIGAFMNDFDVPEETEGEVRSQINQLMEPEPSGVPNVEQVASAWLDDLYFEPTPLDFTQFQSTPAFLE